MAPTNGAKPHGRARIMLNVTNTLIDDITNDLLESGIWDGAVEMRGTCATWCELGIPGHTGPCLADRRISGTRGIRNITMAIHSNGHLSIALGLYQRIHAEADLMPLKSGIADMLREIAA